MYQFSNRQSWLPLAMLALLVGAVFINIGIYPLYLEEPRRALISLEMLYNDNIWVPTEFGVYYYKKPPVFNWVIIAGYKLFGSYSETAVRFFSVVSYLAMGLLVFVFGRRHVGFSFGVYAAAFFFVCSDLLFYFTVIGGEIDIFYALVTWGSFLTIFYFDQKKRYYLLFTTTYLLGAIGTLTKGLPSVAFLGISLLAWFMYRRDFKRLLTPPHFAGIAVYLAIVGGYIYIYSRYNDPLLFLNSEDSVLTQTTDRTLFTNGAMVFLSHFALFPLELLKILAPGSLFVIFLAGNKIRSRLLANDFIAFCAVMFLANISIYWISPGTASRYLYMLFPPAMCVLVYAMMTSEAAGWRKRLIEVVFGVVIGLLAAASAALPWIDQLSFINHLSLISMAGAAIFLALLVAYIRFNNLRLVTFIVGIIAARLLFDLTVLPVRAFQSSMYEHMVQGQEIAGAANGDSIYMHSESRISRTSVFYIEKLTGGIVRITDRLDEKGYYLVTSALLDTPEASFESVYYFRQGQRDFHLAKRKN